MRTIACMSMKGGVGKTTIAVTIAVGLARRLTRKRRLLLVDCDPQSNATMTMLDGRDADEPTLADVLNGSIPASEAIRPSRLPAIDILPASYSLADVPTSLAAEMGRERRLKAALTTIADRYETCIIDSPPQLSLISINVLEASDDVLVPADSSLYSVVGIARLEETVAQVRKYLGNRNLKIIGIVVCNAQRSNAARDLEKQLRKTYGPMVFRTVIPASAEVDKAIARNRTVIESAPSSPVAVAFDHLILEISSNGKTRTASRARSNAVDDAA